MAIITFWGLRGKNKGSDIASDEVEYYKSKKYPRGVSIDTSTMLSAGKLGILSPPHSLPKG